jgi:hypothetical protein
MSRLIGFSTGALAFGEYGRGLEEIRSNSLAAVELSALRQPELEPLVNALDALDLYGFQYISFHAPSDIAAGGEELVVNLLLRVAERGWPIIVHPDVIENHYLWRQLGALLCVENMDKRKPIGRTADELRPIFDLLPDASFCFDAGHARQVDSTMTEAYLILRRFGAKLRQVHVSEVNTRSKHDALSYASLLAFRRVADMIPLDIPLIVESVIPADQISAEVEHVRAAFPIVEPGATTDHSTVLNVNTWPLCQPI